MLKGKTTNPVIDNSTLQRGEAVLIMKWLVHEKGNPPLDGGWYALWRLTPKDVAEKFKVDVLDVLLAARRIGKEE